MPSSWTKKDERQYKHIKEGLQKKGRKRSEEIAARTVNKQRRKEGRTPNRTTQGTGNPRSPLQERSKDELMNLAAKKHIRGRSRMTKAELVAAIQEHNG